MIKLKVLIAGYANRGTDDQIASFSGKMIEVREDDKN